MREEDVPQDDSFYGGHVRACYAVNAEGKYVVATSRGWDAERIATAQALADLEERVETVRRRVIAGELSPLAYHISAGQMTPRLLAQNAGTWAWRVRRHLRPSVFRGLGRRMIARYAECLNVPVDALLRVPPERARVFTDADLGPAETAEKGEKGTRT